jgi:hypothetical protein
MQEQQAIPQTNRKEETTITKHTNEVLQLKFINLDAILILQNI